MKFLFAERDSVLSLILPNTNLGTALPEPESKNLKGGGKGTAIGQQTRAILDCQVSLDSFGAELLFLIAIGIKIFPVLRSGQNCRL